MICPFIRSQRIYKPTEPAAIIYGVFLSEICGYLLSKCKRVVLNSKTCTAAPPPFLLGAGLSYVYCE